MVVGAGFAGSVLAERLATQDGYKVLLVEKRPHIAGNAYDYYDDAGILVHKYGPHIFHCNSRQIYEYLSQCSPNGVLMNTGSLPAWTDSSCRSRLISTPLIAFMA